MVKLLLNFLILLPLKSDQICLAHPEYKTISSQLFPWNFTDSAVW